MSGDLPAGLADAIGQAVANAMRNKGKGEKPKSAATRCYELMRDAPLKALHDEYGEPYFLVPEAWLPSVVYTPRNSDASDAKADATAFTYPQKSKKEDRSIRITSVTSGSSVTRTAARYPLHMGSHELRCIIAKTFYDAYNDTLSETAIRQALITLSGQPSGSRVFYNRVGIDDSGHWWVDLGDARFVEVDDEGWKLRYQSPVPFRHFGHQGVMPEPKRGRGDVFSLLDFVNFGDVDSQCLHLVWAVESLIPGIISCIEFMYGGRGTFKTSGQISVKQVFDPSIAGALTMSSDPNTLNMNLDHHRIPVFDNVGYLSQDQSDTLCRGVTGAAYQKRRLYSDDDDVTRYFRRCIAMNGINAVVDQADLSQRLFAVESQPVPESMRKTDGEVQAALAALSPGILADALDMLVRARCLIRDGFTVRELPRMADWALWGSAVCEAAGIPYEKFLNAYALNQRDAESNVVRGSVVGGLMLDYLQGLASNPDGNVMAKELYNMLRAKAVDQGVDVRRDFPGNVRWFSDLLRRVAPSFPSLGYRVLFKKSGQGVRVLYSRLRATKLDELSEAGASQLSDTKWGVADLREFRKKILPNPLPTESPIPTELPKPLPEVLPTLGERLDGLRRCFVEVWVDVVEDEEVFKLLDAEGVGRAEAAKLISVLMRDGFIYSPRPGWFRRAA